MSSTLMPGLDSSRSTCFIACLLARPRAAASPCPMAATASEAPCITPRVASHRLSMRLACRSAPSTPPSTWRTSLNENWLVMVALMRGSAAFGSWLRSRFGRWGPAKSGSAKTHDLNAGVAHSILFGIPSGRADSFIPTPSKAQNEGMPEYQTFKLNDTLIDTLLGAVQAAINAAEKEQKEVYFQGREQRNQSVSALADRLRQN